MKIEKKVTVTKEEVIEYLRKSNIECIMCGGFCDDLIERQREFLKLKRKNYSNTKE